MYGDISLKKLLVSLKNPFWNDTIKSLMFLFKKTSFQSIEALLATPIRYNSSMIQDKLISWANKGIMTIGDIIYENGIILSKYYIEPGTFIEGIRDYLKYSCM